MLRHTSLPEKLFLGRQRPRQSRRRGKAPLGLGFVAALLTGWFSPAAAEEIAESHAFDVSVGEQLRVDVADANVEVSTGGGEVTVDFVLDGNLSRARKAFAELEFDVQRNSAGVAISSARPRGGWNWDWSNSGGYSITARVRVPARFDLDIRTGDGNVTVAAIEGDVSVSTGDGNIDLERVDGSRVALRTGDGNVDLGVLDADEVTISTGDGNVRLAGLIATEATVRTGDGNIDVRGISGAIDATTGDGNLALRFEDFSGASLRTGDGDVEIVAPASLAADLSLRGGDVMLRGEFSAFRGERKDRRVEGALNGGGALLRAATGDGDVTLRLDD